MLDDNFLNRAKTYGEWLNFNRHSPFATFNDDKDVNHRFEERNTNSFLSHFECYQTMRNILKISKQH